ncbi:MAG: c-type cytochrome [Hyphomicrobiales bacterium]|nr:MAG: c-type cytochrome [Hyphomicrobiales bacterium]
MKLSMIAAAAGFAVLSVASAAAQPRLGLGDAAAGKQLAERLCATCHAVAPAATATATANTDIKSFASIAARPNLTAEQLAGRIIIPHPAMPDTQLKVSEIRDIIAYILSLKP